MAASSLAVAAPPPPPEAEKFLAFADELRRLKSDAHAMEMRLFRRAAEIEASVPAKTWAEHYVSFDGFLREFQVCSPARYRHFVAALRLADVEPVADQLGVGTTIQVAELPDAARRATMIEAAIEHRTARGVQWSDSEARRVRVRVAGAEPKDTGWNTRATEREALRQENLELKKRIYSYEQEVAALQEENARLRKERPLPPKKHSMK